MRALFAKAIKGEVDAARILLERHGGRVTTQDELEPLTQINVRIFENRPVLQDQPPVIEGGK